MCPLKVCCSPFGFCGITKDFCGDVTVAEPVCTGSSATKRTIGYYEGWNLGRNCDTMEPEEIPIGGYTHINFAFLYIDPKLFTITPMASNQQDLYQRAVALKKRKPGLEVWISIGGWDFNDPGATANTFSQLAAFTSRQDTFFQSLLSFLETYGFDGVDLDWWVSRLVMHWDIWLIRFLHLLVLTFLRRREYPVASERGGSEADFNNFVKFLQNLRAALNSSKRSYGLTITLPSSYWYLRHFDIVNLAKSVDWVRRILLLIGWITFWSE